MGDGSERGMRLGARTLADTRAIAAEVAAVATVGDVVLLRGEMGAGKTAFAQGFAAALGVTEPVTSPTFTLVHTYDTGRLVVHHADLYRLEHHGEIDDLSFGELLDSGVLLVEWGEVAEADFPDRLVVELTPVDGDADARDLALRPAGRRWGQRWAALVGALAPWRVAPC